MSLVSRKQASSYAALDYGRTDRPGTASTGGILCRMTVPMSWRRLNGPPTEDLLETFERPNQRVLGRVVDTFDLAAAEISEEEEAALAPLHHKLNMLIEMIGRTCYGNPADMPSPVKVELGPRYLYWNCEGALAEGDWLTASLYVHPIVLDPLVLCGQVDRIQASGQDAENRITLRLCQMGKANTELLGRFVFLENRHNISVERCSAKGATAKPRDRRFAGLRRMETPR